MLPVRAWLTVASAVLLALASASTARPAGAAGCPTSGLVVWLDTNGDAAAGSTFFNLEFTNLSGRRCSLRGYPGVSAVDLAGRQLGTPAGRNPQKPVRTISLAPGASAGAVLQVAHAGVFPRSACRTVTAAGLRVYPPNQTRAKLVPFPFSACSRSGPAYLHVEAVGKPVR